MQIEALYSHLRANGFDRLPLIGSAKFIELQELRLVADADGIFRVVFTERGKVTETVLQSPDERAACAKFSELLHDRFWHVIGFLDEQEAESLAMNLAKIGIVAIRNDLPSGLFPDGPRYRLFAKGADLAKAWQFIDAQKFATAINNS
jgi:hypothetical protein